MWYIIVSCVFSWIPVTPTYHNMWKCISLDILYYFLIETDFKSILFSLLSILNNVNKFFFLSWHTLATRIKPVTQCSHFVVATQKNWASLVAQVVKNLPSMQEAQVQSLGWEDQEKGLATHSSILPGEIHGQRSLAACHPRCHKESDMTQWLTHPENLSWGGNIKLTVVRGSMKQLPRSWEASSMEYYLSVLWNTNTTRTSLMSQTGKNPHSVQETRVQSTGQEDPLEKRMATQSSNLAWRIKWIEETGGLQRVTNSQTQLSD